MERKREREGFDSFASPPASAWDCRAIFRLVARCSCRVLRVNHLSSIPRPSAERDKVSRKDRNPEARDARRVSPTLRANFSQSQTYSPISSLDRQRAGSRRE